MKAERREKKKRRTEHSVHALHNNYGVMAVDGAEIMHAFVRSTITCCQKLPFN